MSSLKFKNENGEWQTITGTSSVVSFNGRAGAIKPRTGDYTAEMVGADTVGSAASALEEAKAYADELSANAGSGVTVYEATIGTTWTEDSETGVKSQNVAIEGVTASNTATVDHVFTDGTEYADFVEAENQYLICITNGYAETYDGGVTFHIFGDAPTVAIPIIVEVA